ncbi:hypothetical protein LXD69_04385 [Flavobacterium sediminilitoris]|uniref:DUF3592 domain-containing protein n=1 Tax=Flavobacterium sediminilitoris TaxID=2024526 RepID=A0ABY4HRD2_9FLAO|nr:MULTISPECIES: hypothetical protein [Flavobacterium]UOX34747.1 hypothetical protein LXD69_04385 [Flavobacterium sediminilitoris]
MKKTLIGLIIIVVLILSLRKTLILDKNSKLINSNYIVTKANIIDYYEIGISNYYLTYEYIVKNVKYTNKFIPKNLYKDCEDNQKCIGKQIYIRYYPEDSSISEPIYDSIP